MRSASAFFRGDDDAAGVAVYAVAQRRSKGILLARMPFALLRHIGLNIRDEGVIIPYARAVAQHARLLVGEEDVFILIYYVELRRSDLEIGIFLARLLKNSSLM